MNIHFGKAPFSAMICLNGLLPHRDVFEQLASLPLIAADGAANTLLDMGVGPEYIVGDMDSVSAETIESLGGATTMVVDEDQNRTDFEKCLAFAEQQLWKNVLVVGLHGGDLEHTLNNWSIVVRFGRGLSITVLEEQRYAIPVYESFRYNATENETLSLIPQPLARLTTQGLRWNLTDEELSIGIREGARNEATDSNVSVEIHSGSLLFVCDSRLPVAPEMV